MTCRCGSNRILRLNAKCDDSCSVLFSEQRYEGYVPHISGIKGGSYITLELCLDCGSLQDFKPVSDYDLRVALGLEDELDKELDMCEVCGGAEGGVPGNENVVDGVVVCDYCDTKRRQA